MSDASFNLKDSVTSELRARLGQPAELAVDVALEEGTTRAVIRAERGGRAAEIAVRNMENLREAGYRQAIVDQLADRLE